jgi:hypothetical protein
MHGRITALVSLWLLALAGARVTAADVAAAPVPLAGTAQATPAAPRPAAQSRNLGGLWLLADAPASKRETLKPEYAARFPTAVSGGPAAPQRLAESARRCVPSPFFGASGGYLMRIIQTATQVTLLSEENSRVRRIYLDRDFPEKLQPSNAGFTVGHWEGNTLVAETRGLRSLDGAPTLPDYRVVEKLRRGADGLTLEQDISVESSAYATPGTRSYRYFARPDLRWQPPVCEEQPAPLAPAVAR